ncbi:MAG: type II toxin-antitoxin system HicA family toxin [Methanospirillaceae archaeon]|nr:type II toxin-antitoxin system HicA family toxin [Methanospirillaceae archaeon]
MSTLPVLSSHEVIKALSRAGFIIKRQSGSHIHMWHVERKTLVTVPNHNELTIGTLLSIIRQSKMEREEFLLFLD